MKSNYFDPIKQDQSNGFPDQGKNQETLYKILPQKASQPQLDFEKKPPCNGCSSWFQRRITRS